MIVFEIVVVMLLVGAVLAAVARRVGAPYPALVALAGAALAFVPSMPSLVLDPELTLVLFVAPVLIDAAFDASPRDLRANWRPVASLALGSVALTIAVVATLAKLLVPDMPWGAAIALGAIVSPPDAAAATTVLKQLRPPHRLLVILEGESLFNDASALLVYRLAVGATASGFLSGWSVLPNLLGVTAGSVILGLVLVRLTLAATARIRDVGTAVVFQFCTTFGVWILAERLHLSGIITTVVFAMAASRRAALLTPARVRIPSWAVWGVAVFVLNVLAFTLVGFQLKDLAARLSRPTAVSYAGVAAAICVAAILSRIAWVTGAAMISRRRRRPGDSSKPGQRDELALTPRGAAVVGWCGMRGIVTLAAALALPNGGDGSSPFPYRDLILVASFGVVFGTLVLQGLTLRPLLLWLRLEDDGAVEREVRLARVEAFRAAVEAAAACPGSETAELVLSRFKLEASRAEQDQQRGSSDVARSALGANTLPTGGRDAEAAVVRAATAALRRRLVALRTDGTIGDAAFQRVEEELDWVQLGWSQLLGAGQQADREV